jgi:hypothetical protein
VNSGRFQQGHSGNQKGRPRKEAPFGSDLRAFFDQTMTVKQNGVERELTREEVLQLRAVERAMKGEPRAIGTVLKMILKRQVWRASRPGRREPKPEVRIVKERDSGNAIEAMCLLGIAIPRPYYLRPGDKYSETPPDEDELPNYDKITIRKWAIDAALERNPDLSSDTEFSSQVWQITEKQDV